MHFIDGGVWGMHFLWWLFWLVLIGIFFGTRTSQPRHKARETPLQILQRRYAAGELSTQDYEERKKTIERDVPATKT